MRVDSTDAPADTEASSGADTPVREKPDGAIDPAGEAGWYLERERERRGETMDDVSAATGVHPYHLEAIEFGDMTRMPGQIDALEMIGTYAQYLGFDPEPLVEHYVHFLPAPPVAPHAGHPADPRPLSSAKVLRFGKFPRMPKVAFRLKSIPGGAGGLVASLAVATLLLAGVGYMLMTRDGPSEEALIAVAPPPPPPEAPADPMPTASTGEEAAQITIGEEPMPDDQALLDQAAAPPPADDLAGTNLDGLSSLIEEQVPSTAAAATDSGMTSAEDIAMTEDGRQFGASNGQSRLTLKAKAPVWVRIEDSQGNVVMTQMLMKGDTYRVPDREGLVVIARDGGLLSYVIDGQEKGILGTPGEILVGRSLDLKSFGGNG